MSYKLDEQKGLIVDAVFDLNKKVEALKYLSGEAKKEENQTAISIFNELLVLI